MDKKTIIIIVSVIIGIILIGIGVYAYISYNNTNCQDDPITITSPELDFEYNEKKPIIYLYPEQETDITVTLENPEAITCSYPKYTNGWTVKAKPDGTLTELNTGKELYSLYYEAKVNSNVTLDEGFVVSNNDIAEFLDEKLNILGLNYKERQEFIVYWLPILEANDYTAIKFVSNDELMPMNITPNPDTTIRVMMVFKSVNKDFVLPEQELNVTSRDGFVVVEWGGMEIK